MKMKATSNAFKWFMLFGSLLSQISIMSCMAGLVLILRGVRGHAGVLPAAIALLLMGIISWDREGAYFL